MPASPSRSRAPAGIRDRSRSRSGDSGRRRTGPRSRSRSRSPRSDRKAGGRNPDGHGYGCRGQDHDGERERVRDGDGREGGRFAKRRRHDHERGGEPGGGRSGSRDGRRGQHHHRHGDSRHRPHHSARRDSAEPASEHKELPFGARQLSRSDLASFRPLFAHYLDLHKRLDIDSLDETELRGRWKSFIGKWNRGELAEGWYDLEVFARAARDYEERDAGKGSRDCQPSPSRSSRHMSREAGPITASRSLSPSTGNNQDDEQDEEDDYGPPLPPTPGQPHHNHPSGNRHLPPPSSSTTTRAPGPSIPTQTDLSLRDEALDAERSSSLTAHRLARRAHRAQEKALLDETLPRADAGTRERRLEKRKELNEKLKEFREKSPGGEVREGELMGGGDSVEEYRAMLRAREEKRKERVSRREEVERARRAEREERVREYRAREERVVEGLRALARERFGFGGGGEGIG